MARSHSFSQLATVATMLLVAILVLTNTVSADGSISGVYKVSLQLAEQTRGQSNTEVQQITDDLKQLVEPDDRKPVPPPAKDGTEQQKEQNKSAPKPNNGH